MTGFILVDLEKIIFVHVLHAEYTGKSLALQKLLFSATEAQSDRERLGKVIKRPGHSKIKRTAISNLYFKLKNSFKAM